MTIDKLNAWIKEEYNRRTALIEQNSEEAKITWLDHGTRVSFSEVCSKARELGVNFHVVDLRQKIKYPNERKSK